MLEEDLGGGMGGEVIGMSWEGGIEKRKKKRLPRKHKYKAICSDLL